MMPHAHNMPANKADRKRMQIRVAHEANMLKGALRAVDDPAQLAKAARIVRAALQRGKLTSADLDGPVVKPGDGALRAHAGE